MKIYQEKLCGIVFIIIGLFFAYQSLDYKIGSISKIGSGFFPFWVSVAVIILGMIIFITGFFNDNKINIEIDTPLYILLVLVSFVFVFKYTGFIIAGLFLIWASAFIHEKFSLKGTILISFIYVFIITIFKFYILNSLPL